MSKSLFSVPGSAMWVELLNIAAWARANAYDKPLREVLKESRFVALLGGALLAYMVAAFGFHVAHDVIAAHLAH